MKQKREYNEGVAMKDLYTTALKLILLVTFCCPSLFAGAAAMLSIPLSSARKKSCSGTYSPRDTSKCSECERFLIKCHDDHRYCVDCDEYCKACEKDCDECSTICTICYDRPASETLVCNHRYCKTCIDRWSKEEHKKHLWKPSATCPDCRRELRIKAESSCDLCHEPICSQEESKSYTCSYRRFFLVLRTVLGTDDRHDFHERCIRSFALKAAYINAAKKVVFHCPVPHSERCVHSEDLEIPLSCVAKSDSYSVEDYTPKIVSDKVCEICNKKVVDDDECTRYTCKWATRSYFKKEKNHLFHTDCIKPFATRNAYLHENGNEVFSCPADHGTVLYSRQLVVRLSDVFKAEYIQYTCVGCKKKLDPNADDVHAITFQGCAWRFISGGYDEIDEKFWMHDKCYGEHVSKCAREAVGWLGGLKWVYPCPCHEGTPQAHDIELAREYWKIVAKG